MDEINCLKNSGELRGSQGDSATLHIGHLTKRQSENRVPSALPRLLNYCAIQRTFLKHLLCEGHHYALGLRHEHGITPTLEEANRSKLCQGRDKSVNTQRHTHSYGVTGRC